MKAITSHGRWLAALIAAVAALVAAGCGSSGGSSEASARCGSGKPSTAKADSAGGTIPTPDTELSQYGQSAPDSCVYKGPGGFSIDLSKCPSDWDVNAGITDKEISLFTSMPHAGALAAYGAIGDGMKSYLRYVNEHGGVAGRQIKFDIKDDQYQPDLTRKNVDAAIQSNDYAASFAVLGSPNNLAVWDVMKQQCMPQLMVAASDDQFGDVLNHPWTSGMGLDYYNETALWAKWLQDKFPDGARVVEITIDNQLGQSYVDGFARAAKGSNLKIVGNELHAVDAPSIDNQITTAAATHADVLIVNDAGTFCTQALAGVEKSSWHPTVITAQPCAQIQTVYAPLQKQGLTGNGTNVIRYYYAPTDPDNPNQQFAALYKKVLTQQGLDPTNAQIANGWWWAWYVVQSLQDASVMKGGLNRANIVIAARSQTSTYPLMIKGAKYHMNGIEDAYPFEAGRMYKYTDATPSKLGHFVPVGPLIDNEGQLKNWTDAQKSN